MSSKLGKINCFFILFPVYSAFDSEACRTPLPSRREPPADQRGSPTPQMESKNFLKMLQLTPILTFIRGVFMKLEAMVQNNKPRECI